MTVVLVLVLLLNLAVLVGVLWLILGVRKREQDLTDKLLALLPEDALPPQVDAAFTAGRRRVLVIDILNPLQVAAHHVKIAGVAGAVAPGLIRKVVYEQAVKITKDQLALQGVEADVQVYVAP